MMGHPSDRRLLRWATAGRPRRTEGHVTHCSLCESRLERLTELAPAVRSELHAVAAPPAGLEDRTRQRLMQRLLDRETMMVLGDLLELGWETQRILIEEEEEDGDG